VGIYTSNSAEACAHTALDCEADVFVVEDAEQLQKILTVRHKLPRLKAIVQYSGEVAGDGVLSWSQFILLGDQESDLLLEDRLRRIAVNHCCTLIYTSGTTGDPKGVMLSHDNLTWTACATARTFGLRHADDTFQERFISFLPLSHIAAQLEDMYIILAASGQVLFANKDALRGSLVESLKEILPTKLIFVPRVLEKIEEKMREIGKGTSGLKRVVATWAKEKALEYNMGKVDGG
jgi:long-chain-fatty-acid--CoA ligase ACSBG